jgi:endonuclease G, mitochondrial
MTHLHLLFLFLVSVLSPALHTEKKSVQITDTNLSTDTLNFDSLHIPRLLEDMQLIHYLGFSLQYDEAHEQARWVGYHLNAARLVKVASRTDNFRPDPQIITGTATNTDYAKSGYDRGHLAPAGDMAWTTQAMSESFFYSNMSPQIPGFNRGIWKKLEEQVRNWVNDTTDLVVITGPILRDGLPTIGPNNVSIPEYNYKALLRQSGNKYDCIAFVLPNASSSLPLTNFVITIDSLEQLSQLDFFHQLPDSLEEAIEDSLCIPCWFE